ncbi:3-hydroxybutyryl-CoA dehydrogenase [Bombiscardovia nodaiensis]|uniref:3-hydroxybutyryl-CoA dehydrogenase n=1 Tax=Bombiscardovia nodaiensis TaxID=2932181 RepID=A0ABN6SGV7_9BIFI|nr:3-hydroxybutyryl-CoA dehydrogenase [Bombiscardovia nodaiensis]
MKSLATVTVAGGGVLGSQIAYQSAFKGKSVTIYDISNEALKQAKQRVNALRDSYKRDLQASDEQFDAGLERLSYTTDLASALADVDLVIEAIVENRSIKHDFYQNLAKLAPERTIFISNSSTYLPSDFMEDTGRPDRFLNLHFANQIWKMNTAEVMGSPKTSPKVYQQIVQFAREIGMVPIELKKEQPGYVLNTILIPWLNAAGYLWGEDIVDPQTVDKTWMIASGAPVGPFAIFDMIGLRTHYNIVKEQEGDNPKLQSFLRKMKERIEEHRVGIESGEGFYHYPNPEYADPDFLKS